MKLAVFTAGVYAHTSVFLCTVAAKAGEIFALFVNAVQKDIRRISYCTELFGNSVLAIYDRQYLVGRAEYGVATISFSSSEPSLEKATLSISVPAAGSS